MSREKVSREYKAIETVGPTTKRKCDHYRVDIQKEHIVGDKVSVEQINLE